MSSGAAHAHALLPGRRRDRGHPRAASSAKLREFLEVMPGRADEYGAILQPQRDRPAAPARHLPAGRRDAARRSASPGRCCAPRATPGTCARRRPTAPTRTSTFKIPVGTVGDNYDRFAVRLAEIYESVKIIAQALDGLPEGPHITERPQGRAAAAPRARDLDGGADPPLQARHRGLPRAARRDLQPDRVPARRARLLRALRRLLQARARAHARPVVRQPPGARADGPRRLHRRHDRDDRDARPDPRAGSTDEPASRACR